MSGLKENQTVKTNSGYLYPNKKTKPEQPDFRGKVNYKGKDLWVSAWKRVKDGDEFLSLALTDPEERSRATQPSQSSSQAQTVPVNEPTQGHHPATVPIQVIKKDGAGSVGGALGDIFEEM